MGDLQIVLFAVAIFLVSVDAQAFNVTPVSGYRRGNEDIALVWEFDVGTGSFLGGEWWNTENLAVMTKSGSDDTTVASGFEHKFEPIGEYGMKILNFTELDNGIYTCRMIYHQNTVQNLDGLVNISASTIEGDALNTPNLIVAFEDREFVVSENFTKVAVPTEFTTYAPINNPPLVDAVISVGQETKNCFRLSDENCTLEFVPNGNFTVTVSLSHPLVHSANVTWIMTVEDGVTGNKSESDKGPDDPGAECKWWCILLIVLAVLAILGIIVGLMYHYRLACFRSKSSAQIDVNQKQETNGFGMENKAY